MLESEGDDLLVQQQMVPLSRALEEPKPAPVMPPAPADDQVDDGEDDENAPIPLQRRGAQA